MKMNYGLFALAWQRLIGDKCGSGKQSIMLIPPAPVTEIAMPTAPCLFDRFDDDQPASRIQSIIRDLESLLNTRCAIPARDLVPYVNVMKSVVNFGLIDFAAMCVTSDDDRRSICTAVKLAITRHEPRLRRVAVTLENRKDAINRIDFVIHAYLNGESAAGPMRFNAVFRPSLQKYSVQKSGSGS